MLNSDFVYNTFQRVWILFGLSYLITVATVAQPNVNLHFDHLTTTNGLSSNFIRCILQDSQGYMWFGTNNGLNRYDGYSFEVFRPELNNPYSIADHHINFLYEDSNNELWIATNSGLCKFDRNQNRFISYSVLEGKIANAVWEDRLKNLWVSSYNLIFKYDKRLNQFIQFPEFTTALVTSGITLPNDNLLIGTHTAGLYQIDVSSNIIKQYLNNPVNKNSLCSNEITALKFEKNGRVWISTRNGLDVLNIEDATFTHVGRGTESQTSLLNQSVRSGVHFKENEVWIGTQSGISILNKKSQQFTHFTPDVFNPQSLSEMSIWAIFGDKQGRTWVGTFSGGINLIDPLREQFTDDPPLTKEHAVSAILQDSKERMWLGIEEGIVLNDSKNVYHFSHDSNQPNSLSSNTVLNIFEDKNKNIWIATWNGGLSRFDEQNKNFVNFEVSAQNPDKLATRNVYCITQSSLTNQLLLASFDGFHVLTSEENQHFLNYKHHPNDSTSLSANFCKVVFEDSKSNIWIGTDRGFNLFDIQTKKFRRFIHSNTDKRSISNNFINCILEDKEHRLWVGTANGLNRMTRDSRFEVHLNPDDSFNYIQSMLEDENGNIWISTISGAITKFNPSTRTFENYNEFNSSFKNEFRSNSAYKDKNGKLHFGGGKGLFSFYPDKIKKNPYIPPLLFTDLKIFNQSVNIGDYDSVLTKHISYSKQIGLNHTLSVFSLAYLALNFTHPEKNQYAYKLEGFDHDWIYAGNKREATYTNLNAGTYTFKVKASNNDGVWNQEGINILITITPPWWKTWWVKASIVLLIVGVGFSFHRARINSVKNQKLEKDIAERTMEINKNREDLKIQNERLEMLSGDLAKVNASKDKLFAILAHDLRSPIKSLSALMDLVSQKAISPQVLQIYTDKLKVNVKEVTFTLNNLLYWAKGQMQGLVINPQAFSLHTLVETNFNLMQEVAFAKKITLTNLVHQNLTLWADRDHVDLVLRNLLNNAIKFTPVEGTIIVAAIQKSTVCQISVSDDGVGITAENLTKIFRSNLTFTTQGTAGEKGTGLGLSMCQEMIEMNGGNIWVESELGRGTVVYFTLPLQN